MAFQYDFFNVLYWSSYRPKIQMTDENTVIKNEMMSIVAGFRGDQPISRGTFELKDLLPPDMLEDPNPYYIFSIHHLKYYMGYIIVSLELDNYDQIMMKSWLVNLGALLENWRIRTELNVTVNRLENLYNRDMLTGLYNRRGYEPFFEEIYEKCRHDGTDIAVLLVDMDDLKRVNDNYGHTEGDYSIRTIAEAMSVASGEGEICFRTGGDEFVVVAGNYDMEKVESYCRRLREHIDARIKRDRKPYRLQVSIGVCLRKAESDYSRPINEISEEYMRKADVEMYREKKAHKSQSETV